MTDCERSNSKELALVCSSSSLALSLPLSSPRSFIFFQIQNDESGAGLDVWTSTEIAVNGDDASNSDIKSNPGRATHKMMSAGPH